MSQQSHMSYKPLIAYVFLLSTFVNILVLTSPFFMLLVYDKVISSSSVETLGVLALLALILFGFYGALDHVRARIGARIGASIERRFNRDVLTAQLEPTRQIKGGAEIGDIDKIVQFSASPVSIAIIDALWSPLFVFVAFVFHFWLGVFSIIAVGILVAVAIANQVVTAKSIANSEFISRHNDVLLRELQSERETITALGMRERLIDRWRDSRKSSQAARLNSADMIGAFSSTSKTLRLIAQSGILALGAFLVINGKVPTGMMIAGSILLGRTLAPLDMIIGQWRLVSEARSSWQKFTITKSALHNPTSVTELPRPKGAIHFKNVYASYTPGAQPILQNITFEIKPGQVLGVIGESGSGKSTLAKLITGDLPALSGRVEIDGATIGQYSPGKLGSYIGYLPQDVRMLSGSIADNICRFDDDENRDQDIVHAAMKADVHDMITGFAQGYNTKLPGGVSGGQRQRIGLARALYKSPPLLIFDEPNSNLDGSGTAALNRAIKLAKNQNQTVIIIAHRPAAIQECDMILMLEGGRIKAFGPRDEVLKAQVKNYQVIQRVSNNDN